jgi:hypothetical protein
MPSPAKPPACWLYPSWLLFGPDRGNARLTPAVRATLASASTAIVVLPARAPRRVPVAA